MFKGLIQWELDSKKNNDRKLVLNRLRFQASSAKYMRTTLLWFVTQRVVVTTCRRFGTACRSHLQESIIQDSSSLKTGPMG